MKMKSSRLFVLVAALMAGSALRCYAPSPPVVIVARVLSPYITSINAQVQGAFTGVDTLPDGSGTGIRLASLQHGLTLPFDAASGLTTGQRKHGPLTLVKQLDSNTPKFYRALANNEILTQVVIRFYGTPTNGVTTNIFTYTLNNAKVVAIRNWQPNANDPAAAPYVQPEEVSFTYQSINWRDELTSLEFQDTYSTSPP
ncbi:MAG: type VI secretion system tube protein Hcp [Pedosphaera sp.]|nr:type VI secretion system tube protein Hcp [Pedosphaera sp.]